MKASVLATLALLAGCAPQWTVFHEPNDRIWLISRDYKVWRCIDATPKETPFKGGLSVFCKEAYLYNTREEPMSVQGESKIRTGGDK